MTSQPTDSRRSSADPCTRPKCGGELHTDPWGVPVQCPHAEPVAQEDTGRRCPRCDCPDGHEQCQHCKICPHAGITPTTQEQSMLDPATERIALTFRRYAQQFTVDEDLFFDVDVSVQQGIFDHCLFQLKTRILTDDLPPETFTARQHVVYEVPASTWQMWKKRHARRWYARRLVARWPVRYEPDPEGRGVDAVCTFDLERYRTYPRAKFRLPEQRFGAPVLVHAIRDLHWTEERAP